MSLSEPTRAASAATALLRDPVALARRFHELYEDIAPSFSYETRPETRVPWEELPQANRFLMIAVCAAIQQEVSDATA